MKYLLLISLLVSGMVSADESPYGISAADLLEKANTTGDTTYLAIASYRCAALLTLFNGIIARDTAEQVDTEGPSNLLFIGIVATKIKLSERGVDRSRVDEVDQRAYEDFDKYLSTYRSWLEQNYANSGDYWGTHETIRAEITACRGLAAELAEY